MPIDPRTLPQDTDTLQKIVVDLIEQLDRSLAEQNTYQNLLRELLETQRNRKSEQLTKEQLALFEAAWQAQHPESQSDEDDEEDDDLGGAPQGGQQSSQTQHNKRGGRQMLARHLVRERIVHDLAEAEKHCASCGRDLRLIEEESSEHGQRQLTGAGDRGEMGRSSAAASQEKMFARHAVTISRKTMGGWMAQCAKLLDPLYQAMKEELFGSKVIGTDDTSVKVLDRKLPFARIGRIWPYVGDAHHPVIVYDYTPRDRGQVRRNFWKTTKGICRRTLTRSTMRSSKGNVE